MQDMPTSDPSDSSGAGLPAAAAHWDQSCSEVLISVKESLRKIMERRGNVVLSEILVHRFASAKFQLQEGKLNGENNLYSFLMLVSRLGKSKNGNKNRNQKKNDTGSGSLVHGAKTSVDLRKVHIGSLQCSETWEIFSVKSSDLLNKVVLDVVPDGLHHNEEKVSIRNPTHAKAILQGLDTHFLLSVLQNGMLQLTLSSEEAQVVQAMRLCRNYLYHTEVVPQLEKLKEAARVLQDALTELAQPSQKMEIQAEICAVIKRLDSNNLIEELQEELVCNAPNQQFLDRNFMLPSRQVCSLQEVCQLVCQHLEVRVQGEVWSGRTSVLLALYQLWAQGVGPLRSRYRLVLPLLPRLGGPPAFAALPADASSDELVLHHLQQWTPGVLRDYGEAAVMTAVREVVDGALALCDAAPGYCCGPQWVLGPRVVTDWPRGAACRGAGDESTPHSRAVVLLPLKSEQVEGEVCRWQQQPSTQYVLYKQLQDHQLLLCPQALNVFRSVTSKVVRNLDLEMMRALVDQSHIWTSSSNPALDKEFFFKVAFNNILSNERTVPHVSNQCVPAYLVGPQGGPYEFRSLYIEEYCAAMFVSRHVASASWKWLRQPVRFQRVFTFVLQIWNEERTLQEHKATILNFLSVILGLYRMKGKGNAPNKQQWHINRPDDWTLEREGFLREGNPKCKLWLFVFHVVESVIGELWAVEQVLRHLLLYSVWILDVERFNDRACDEFNRLCRKTVSILKRSKSDDAPPDQADLRLPVMKITDRCQDELLNRRAVLLRSLSCFNELCLPMQVKVQQYYNSRDCKYGRGPLAETLARGALGLHQSPVPIAAYTGPLALCFSLQEGALRWLQDLRVTVYSASAVPALLHSCPPRLAVLCLNVDIAASSDSVQPPPPPPASDLSPSGVPPPAADLPPPALNPSCYVRLAIRYSGSLKVLSLLSGVGRVSVLRLHGLYPPEAPDTAALPSLAARCLVLKFVHGCGAQRPPHLLRDWCSRLLSRLTAACPRLQRLIVSRAPVSWRLSAIHDQVMQEAPQLHRLLVQGSDVSLQEARRILQDARPCEEAAAPDRLLQPRLQLEERRQLSRHKPRGFELLIIGVPSGAPLVLPWEPPAGEAISTEDVWGLVQASHHSGHVAFCYEAGRGALQVLRAPTRDLRLHLLLPRLQDEEVQKLNTPAGRHLQHLLAAAQHTRLQCTQLTAAGFLQLVAAMDAVKRRLTSGGRVAPYHVTVLSTQPAPSRRDLEGQQQLLRAELPRLACLNYALFCVLDAGGRALLTVRKSHKGAVFWDLRPGDLRGRPGGQ